MRKCIQFIIQFEATR